jgi:hypothetical protein
MIKVNEELFKTLVAEIGVSVFELRIALHNEKDINSLKKEIEKRVDDLTHSYLILRQLRVSEGLREEDTLKNMAEATRKFIENNGKVEFVVDDVLERVLKKV